MLVLCRDLLLQQKMLGQELVPDEPSSPVIPTVRKTTLAMLKNRVEVLEKEMAGLMGHLGRDSNMEPMQLEEGTLSPDDGANHSAFSSFSNTTEQHQ